MSKSKKRKIWWVVGVSFSVVLFFAYLFGLGSGLTLNRELAKARADGFPVEPEDIFTKPVPNDVDNAATFYEQMVLLTEPSGEEYEAQSRQGLALRWGYTDYEREKVLAYLEANADLTRLTEEAAKRPTWWAGKDWSNPATVILPELRLSRNASKVLASRALLSLEKGDVRAALDDLQRILTIASHMEDAGFSIGHLVAYSGRNTYFSAVELMTTYPSADSEFFRGVLKQVEDWPTSTDWTDVLRLEAYTAVWVPQNFEEMKESFVLWEPKDGLPEDEQAWEAMSYRIPRTRSNAALIALEHWKDVLDTYDPNSTDPMTWARGVDARNVTDTGFWHASEVLAMYFSSHIESAFGAGISDSARREVLRSSLIALLAKRDGRDYLADGLLTDPWTQNDLIFNEMADGFILYSVGQNGIDDGGNNINNDIVFTFPRQREPAPTDFYFD